MRERPILFSGPMVRAILDGKKTVTRRVVKPPPIGADDTVREIYERGLPAAHRCPYGTIGDQLWAKEAHAIVPRTAYAHDPTIPHRVSPCGHLWAVYREGWERCQPGQWRPSIHMPRWASRLTLEVCSVRVERLQAISEDDARAEGCIGISGDKRESHHETPRLEFRRLWDSINGARPGCSWADNPWLWRIEFRKIEDAKHIEEGEGR